MTVNAERFVVGGALSSVEIPVRFLSEDCAPEGAGIESRIKEQEPAEVEGTSDVAQFLKRMRRVQTERRSAARAGLEALARLAEMLRGRSGQCFKVRNFLYSLWNGKPAPLIELVSLDWEVRQDLCAVCLAFGFEDASARPQPVKFFYDAIKEAVTAMGQWEWFLEEASNVTLLRDYVAAAETEAA